ncbi:MAG TPA: hypothetical protein VMH00_12525 [Candidatus Limnocylindrales bacterium]|nr:hypothetical protein [Candidatus Limnocylindrales bacterium]
MKRVLICAAAMLFAGSLALAGHDDAKKGTWSGVVTNDMCGAKDASMAKAACTKTCVKEHGAKYALYNPADKMVYVLEPQDKVDGAEGKTVTVKGTMEGKVIKIEAITIKQ